MTKRRYDSPFFPPSTPRSVDGGVKARGVRGAIGTSWWSRRFIEVLEGLGVDGRLQRGRNYARRGQVISLEIDAGAVTANVQGSRAKPYRVRIGIATFGKAEWPRWRNPSRRTPGLWLPCWPGRCLPIS